MSNELISKIIRLSFWLLFLFSVLFVNCGDNIKVYFSIVTHEISLRVIHYGKKLTFDRKTSNFTKRIVSKYREGFYKESCLNRKQTPE
jgi:hypothetical protein